MIVVDQINEEVFVAQDSIVHFGDEEIAFVKQQARISPRMRARICAHKMNDDPLHEMLIAMSAGSYIHPHKHFGKSESFHIVEGEVEVVIFDENGRITNVLELGILGSGRKFFYRLSEAKFHTLIIHTDFLVLHEITNGPFVRDNLTLAPFAPTEGEFERVKKYMHTVSEQTLQYLRG